MRAGNPQRVKPVVLGTRQLECEPVVVLAALAHEAREAVTRDEQPDALQASLAALIGIPSSYRVPGSYVQTNVVGTLNLLQTARTCNG